MADALWQVWLLYWFSAAFLGTFTAILTAWGLRALYKKLHPTYKLYYRVNYNKEKPNDHTIKQD